MLTWMKGDRGGADDEILGQVLANLTNWPRCVKCDEADA